MEQETVRPVGVPRDLDAAVARVRSPAAEVIGGGFLVDPSHVITCAHVVARALGHDLRDTRAPDGTVVVDFPLIAPPISVQARVEMWHPVDPDDRGDIAVLSIEGEPPQGPIPARLVSSDDFWGHPFRTFGFPRRHDNGVWAAGVLRGAQGAGWIQMEAVNSGYPVEAGFSGGPVWDDELAGVVGMTVAADARSDLRTAYLIPAGTLIDAVPPLARRTLPPCPYRGLYPFRVQDAALFFGREDLTDRLVQEVTRRPLVAVVGPSGSGKSSVVFAGLLPQLLQQPGWVGVSMRPAQASSPLHALAGALLPVLEPDCSETERLAAMDPLAALLRDGHLPDVVGRVLVRQHATRLLLVVDQFEELFGRGASADATSFIRTLLSALPNQRGDPPTFTIVLTLRADFLGSALQDPLLAQALEGSVITIGQMGREQLRSVLLRPLPPGVGYEAGLVQRILEDVGEEPGSLPLLEFALTLLWEKQERGLLSHAAYEQLGGVDGALATYAERVFSEQLRPEDQKEARRLFIQLVRPSDPAPVRRVARRAELGEARWQLGQRIAATRLLVADRDAAGAESVELVHEALIDGWARLHNWVAQDMAFRAWQEQLRASVTAWENVRRDSGALLRGAQLAEAERWLQERQDDLSDTEQGFIGLSKTFRGRAVRRLRIAVAALTVLLLAAAGLGVVVMVQRNRAAAQSRAAQSTSLATLATSLAGTKPDVALALSAAAYNLAHAEDATRTLTGMATDQRDTDSLLSTSLQSVAGAQFSPADPDVLAVEGGSDIVLWNVKNNKAESGTRRFNQQIQTTAFSHDGSRVAVALSGTKPSVALWRPADNTVSDVSTTPTSVYDTSGLQFSPDDTLVAFCTANSIDLWTVDNSRFKSSIPLSSTSTCSFGFTADAGVLYMDGGQIKHWDIRTGRITTRHHVGDADQSGTLAVTPDGHVALCNDGQAHSFWWDVAAGKKLEDLTQLSYLGSLAFTPDSRWAFIQGQGSAQLVDVSDRQLSASFTIPSAAGAAVFSQGASLSRDGRVIAFPEGGGAVGLTNVAAHRDVPVDASEIALVKDDPGRVVTALSNYSWAGGVEKYTLDNSGHVVLIPASAIPSGSDPPPSALSPDGHYFAQWDQSSNRFVLTDIADTPADPGRQLEGLTGTPKVLAFDPRGRFLASVDSPEGADRPEIVVWSTGTGAVVHRFPLPKGYEFENAGLAVHPSGQTVAIYDAHGRVTLWEEAGKRRRELPVDGATGVSFSPSGRWFSVVTPSDTRLWDMTDIGQSPRRFTAVLPGSGPARFGPGDTYIATSTGDQTSSYITVWRTSDEGLVGTVAGYAQDFLFTPDGRHLLVASSGVHLISFSPSEARATICRILGDRNLSTDEWNQFAPGIPYTRACG
jgi:WD40 repeat protein